MAHAWSASASSYLAVHAVTFALLNFPGDEAFLGGSRLTAKLLKAEKGCGLHVSIVFL
jgi:hypothetical protein